MLDIDLHCIFGNKFKKKRILIFLPEGKWCCIDKIYERITKAILLLNSLLLNHSCENNNINTLDRCSQNIHLGEYCGVHMLCAPVHFNMFMQLKKYRYQYGLGYSLK